MIQKILLATDGSKRANRAAEKTVELARQLGDVEVTLLYVTPGIPSKSSLIESHFNIRGLLEEKAHLAIIQTELLLRKEQVRFKLDVALGDPAEEIVRKADGENFDLLVIGSRGLKKLREIVLGSVGNRVLRDVLCPVLIVK